MQNEITRLAKNLISIPSTMDNKPALKDILNLVKKELGGLRYNEYEKNGVYSLLFYNTPKPTKVFKLILNAHLDVVPGSPNQYKPSVVGNKIFGRGAYDMKGAAATEIVIFKQLAEKVGYPLGLQLVTDEEIGGFNGAKYQTEKGIKAECMLVGESSSDFVLGIRAKGIIWASIAFEGTSAHAAYPWEGKNAIFEMNKFLTNLWRTFPIPNKEVWETTVNVSTVGTSNVTTNKVPKDAKVQLDMRYIPGDDKRVLQKIRAMLPKSAALKIIEYEPARNTPENNFYVQRLKNIASKSLNKTISIVGKNGGSDLRHYPKTAGLEFGPIGHGPHQDIEWVSIKSLTKYYEILKDFLLSLN